MQYEQELYALPIKNRDKHTKWSITALDQGNYFNKILDTMFFWT